MSRNAVGGLDLAPLLPSPGTDDFRLVLSYLGLNFPCYKMDNRTQCSRKTSSALTLQPEGGAASSIGSCSPGWS